MLERGEADLSINVVNDLRVDDDVFGTFLLPQFHVIAACARTYDIERSETIDVPKGCSASAAVAEQRYCDTSDFDSACRLANVRPNAVIESTAAHGLLAMAETGQEVAIVPSILQTNRWAVRTMRVTHRRQLLRISLALLWDRRRMAASSAEHCGEILAEHVRKTFPNGAPARHSNGARRPD